MEETDNHSLCILCCYSFPNSGKTWRKKERAQKVKLIDKFIQQTAENGMAGLSSADLLQQLDLSLCEECLSVMAKAAEKREQAEDTEKKVRQVQLEILKMLRKLTGLVDGYLEEIRALENTVRCSDENCLKSRFKKRGGRLVHKGRWIRANVYQFRNGIINAAKEWNGFRIRDHFTSTHLTSEETSGFSECKVEVEDSHDTQQDTTVVVPIDESLEMPDDMITPPGLPDKQTQERVLDKLETEQRKFQCSKCQKWFPSRVHLRVHKRKHLLGGRNLNQNKTPRVKCSGCGKLVLAPNLFGHKSRCIAAQPNWPHTCAHCFKRFSGATVLHDHLLLEHGMEQAKSVLSCDVCGKVFATNQNMQRHKETHLPPEDRPRPKREEFLCKFCGKILATSASLGHHTRYHCAGKPRKVEKDCVCHKCGKVCNNKRALYSHLHSVCIPAGNFRCQLCGRQGFKTKYDLNRHEKQHQTNAERPFLCGLCGGNFNTNSHLRRHEKLCDGKKKPRKPRWSNMLQTVAKEQPRSSSGEGKPEEESGGGEVILENN